MNIQYSSTRNAQFNLTKAAQIQWRLSLIYGYIFIKHVKTGELRNVGRRERPGRA